MPPSWKNSNTMKPWAAKAANSGSAKDMMAKMLDEMMGGQRDASLEERQKNQVLWHDPRVCRYFLADFCPYEALEGTNKDLGACGKLHDGPAKSSFGELKPGEKVHVWRSLHKLLEELVGKADKEQANNDAKLNGPDKNDGRELKPEVIERMETFKHSIETFLRLSEKAGEEGQIDEAQKYSEQVDSSRRSRMSCLAATTRTLSRNAGSMASAECAARSTPGIRRFTSRASSMLLTSACASRCRASQR